MAKKKTPKPKKSGLTVSRNGSTFKLKWTKIKNCTDQDIIVLVNNKRVKKKDLTASQTSYKYTIDPEDFFPYMSGNKYKPKLKEVSFKLSQTQKKKKQSKFSSQKEFKIKLQGTPRYVQPAQDNTNADTFIYSWDKNASDDDVKTGHKMFSWYRFETCLVNKGDKPNWDLAKTQKIQTIDVTTGELKTNQPSRDKITSSTKTAVIIRELQSDITAKKIRYFRVRSIGPAGHSEYRQSQHQLGGSDPVKIQPTSTSFNGSTDTGTSGAFPINLSNGNPNDSIQVEYAIAAPYVVLEDVSTEVGTKVTSKLILPPGYDGWTLGDTFSGSGVPDTYSFNYPTYVVDDTRLFIRINRIHDGIVSNGVPFIMNTKQKAITSSTSEKDSTPEIVIGRLTSPTLSAISLNESAHEVTVNCTNNARLADGGNHSFIVVYERVSSSAKAIGIIPFSANGETSVTFPYDEGADAFGIRCFVADYWPKNRAASGVTTYNISDILMQSSGIIWQNDVVSKPPSNVVVQRHNSSTALITWDWNWAEADSAEISWSDNEIIWDSIEEPSSYILTNTRQGKRYITDLSPTTYYFKVRFIKTENETTTLGVYSETKTLTLSSAPDIPTLTLSDEDGVVSINDDVTAYWTYKSTDGTPQIYAELAEATRPNSDAQWTYTKLKDAKVNNKTSYTFKPSTYGWTNGQSHYICVKVRSASGKDSEGYSDPVLLRIAPLPALTVHGINEANTDAIRAPIDGEEAYDDGAALALKKLPIEFTVTSVGPKSFCNVVIERDGAFSIDRPDDTNTTGFDLETIISRRFDPGEDDPSTIPVTITADDLKLGSFDDTAKYHMKISVTDEYGQTVSSKEGEYDFTVDWDYYAKMPSATIQIKEDEDIAIITPSATGVQEGDFCRIYRMSSDKPQLILDNGTFGETYVDPFPTFGLFGGYRIVYVSKYMDYKTADHMIAMTEYSNVGDDQEIDQYNKFMVSLDFDGDTAEFNSDVSLSHSWEKDFQLTRYLGGSMQGDWNPGIQRTGTIKGTIPVEYDPDTIYTLHLLADYPGRCHVRTPEGSNFIADVQVKDDREEKWTTRLGKISLSYTKVDDGEDDMMTLTDWRRAHPLPQE